MRNEIILIGPMGVGKTYTSELLSKQLGIPHVWVDAIRYHYYEQIGYSYEEAERIKNEKGLLRGLYQYWKPFELYAVEKILSEYQNCVFDFGAGHSVYDGEQFEKVKTLLSDFNNVFLLLPSDNTEESVEFLMKRRDVPPEDEEGRERIRYFVTHPSNYALCRHIVYVKGKSGDEVCAEILSASGLTPQKSEEI